MSKCGTGKIRYRDRIAALMAMSNISTPRLRGAGEIGETRLPVPAVQRLAPDQHVTTQRIQ